MYNINKAFFSTSTRYIAHFSQYYHLYIIYQPKRQGLNLTDVLAMENALFVHAFDYMFKLTVTRRSIIVSYIVISSWSKLTTCFFTFMVWASPVATVRCRASPFMQPRINTSPVLAPVVMQGISPSASNLGTNFLFSN